MVLVQRQQFLLIFGQFEKPCLFCGPLHRRALWREFLAPLACLQLIFCVKGLVAYRIPAFIAIEIQIAIGLHCFPQSLAGFMMRRLAGTPEAIMIYIKLLAHLYEIRRHFISKFDRINTGVTSRLDHFQPMFVGAGD